ncbi:hypothetical protein QA601_11350 [Chitinispirillales bacterium ANBcel5]|uniref:hypothetical protein n=1 Tax=Cellulosispirillum alkaliphilum TaxID=3039283 RepID=UPI002A575B20|nr:hypothetical protein [Chitinispirillales bacterium ANBcel5]
MFNRNFAIIVNTLIVLCLLTCAENSGVAGGAGAGNPVTISMVMKGAHDKQLEEMAKRSSSEILIEDFERMSLRVSSVYISASRIGFPEPRMNSESQVAYETPISLRGEFVFDLLSGETVTEPITCKLPFGKYEFLAADLAPLATMGSDANIESNHLYKEYQIIIQGEIDYKDTLQSIQFLINSDSTAYFFPPTDQTIDLGSRDTVSLTVQLDETKWLDSISIRSIVEKSLLKTDGSGRLYFTGDPSETGPAAQKAKRIITNIFSSGVLIKEPYRP